MRTLTAVLAAACLGGCVVAQEAAETRWAEYAHLARRLDAVAPTPAGESHIGEVKAGQAVALRFPVPAEPVLGYWLSLGNIVAYSGRGSSYQLVLHRDTPDGPVLYTGPVIVNGDAWNWQNLQPIDVSDGILAADRARGYLEVQATALVQGDGWTIYRHRPPQPVFAMATLETPELRQQALAGRAMRERGVVLVPVPQQIEFTAGALRLGPETRIVFPADQGPDLAGAAAELMLLIRERTGLELKVVPVTQPASAGDLALATRACAWPRGAALAATAPAGGLAPEGYVLEVGPQGALVVGTDPAGCFYGAMSLGQMTQPAGPGAQLQACLIRDWPAFPQRIIQYDVARGQTIEVDYVKRMIRELARCKVNGLLFYMEDDFRFRAYPFCGREGTFTHEKARALAEFARSLHVRLIPQFEALGHAGAVLAHEELRDLREAGGAWVFCTMEPKTWEFLDTVFGELLEAFPDSPFIHVGGDEFEGGFGLCPRCRATIAKDGLGGLYAAHMNRLNQLVRKRGKTMLFWPSHAGPTPALSDMTIQYQDKLEKDCIPTEWIYHGPAAYPTLEQYQKLGFKDVYCSPAVESYSRIWPDHVTTFRAIRGFYSAGAARRCGGAYCTTWEFMHGALWENSWYGLLFAAECSWNPVSTAKGDYNRRFADVWYGIGPGLVPAEVSRRVETTLSEPIPPQSGAAVWRSGWLVSKLLWAPGATVLREYDLKQPEIGAHAGTLAPVAAAALAELEWFEKNARRNRDLTLRAARLGFRLMQYAGDRLMAMREAGQFYREAAATVGTDRAAAATLLAKAQARLAPVAESAAALAREYEFFVTGCGAYRGDVTRLEDQARELAETARRLAELQGGVAAGTAVALPTGRPMGFISGTYTRVGEWNPAQMNEQFVPIRFDVTAALKAAGPVEVEWTYTAGAHALAIRSTQILCDGAVVAEDVHPGNTGASNRGNVYTLSLAEVRPGARYELLGEVAARGGTDSNGIVWLVTADGSAR